MTINDIAILAKVSTGTVDRVIHNRGGVSKKTEIIINDLRGLILKLFKYNV